jgi:ferredoxin/flavodoxin---NADP+ reductase
MPHPVGTPERPLKVAVVGAGPSGFYAIASLYKRAGLEVQVDLFDRLPTPYGLVRGGVAPDHQQIKSIAKKYHETAQHGGFRFFGNVKIGKDLSVAELEERYHQIVWAIGNETDKRLGIEGETLHGVHSATEFVGWYNGHPDFRDRFFALDRAKRVVVIGNGNVSMDVARILAHDPKVLGETDIAAHAHEMLERSTVEEVVVLGRRGPAEAAFSPKEVKELGELEGVDLVVDPEQVKLDPVSETWMQTPEAPRTAVKNVEFLREVAARGPGTNRRKIRLVFLASPLAFLGTDHVTAVRVAKNELRFVDGEPKAKETGETFELGCELAFKAVGYRGIPLEGVPFDEMSGTIPNAEGRVLAKAGLPDILPRHYVVGWAKRGPTGLIGTNGPDANATVDHQVEDIVGKTDVEEPTASPIEELLAERQVDVATFADWLRLDLAEIVRGKEKGKVREKFCSVEEMMDEIRRLRPSGREADGGAS